MKDNAELMSQLGRLAACGIRELDELVLERLEDKPTGPPSLAGLGLPNVKVKMESDYQVYWLFGSVAWVIGSYMILALVAASHERASEDPYTTALSIVGALRNGLYELITTAARLWFDIVEPRWKEIQERTGREDDDDD